MAKRPKPFIHFLATPLIVLFLAGCGAVSRDAVVADLAAHPAQGRYIRGVPFFPQDRYMCGPAALAGVIGYWGGSAGMDDVARGVYEEKLKGTLPMDLLIYAREKGLDASYYRGSFDDLREKISSGAPLILFLNLGYDDYPVGHYIVAVGYDDRAGVVLAHSAMNREEVFTYDRLKGYWEKTGFSTLLVSPRKTNDER